MADIELVIRIPEEMYKWVYDVNKFSNDYGTGDFIDLVKNGTSLPKGHGEIIDTKEFIKSVNDWADNIDSYEAYEQLEIVKALLQNHANTIIEADKAEGEGKK